MKVVTTISLDSEVRKKAQKQGINISKAAEEGILRKLDEPGLISNMEKERLMYLDKARDLKHKIDELKSEQARKESIMGPMKERLDKSIGTIFKVIDNEGSIADDRIAYIAKSNGVLYDDLIKEYNLRIKEKQG